jgi:hypothetical protein
LKLSLWIDAAVSREDIARLAETRLRTAFGPETASMLNPIRVIGIREEADIYGTEPPGSPVRFDRYEIHGVKAYGEGSGKYCEQVDESKADYWSLFGHIPGQGADCIGDFATREHAEEVFARITGRRYDDDNNKSQAR